MLETIIVQELLRILPELVKAAQRGDTTPALEARARRLALDAAIAATRRHRATKSNQ